MEQGDIVLYIPMWKGWGNKKYAMGIVTEVRGRYVQIASPFSKVLEYEHVEKVRLHSKGKECLSI